MNATDATVEPSNIQWSHPNIPWAIGISIGAGLATAVGGALILVPQLLKKVPQKTVLAVSLALSAGVMIYVSFIEIFAKSHQAIASTAGVTEGSAAAITTICFFAGMLCCALLEVLVHRMMGSHSHDVGSHSHDEAPRTRTDAAGPPSVDVELVGDGASTLERAEAGQPTKAAAYHAVQGGELLGDPAESAALSRMGIMTALAIAIHNFPEGLATFLASVGDTRLGASLGVAIAVHNVPEGCARRRPLTPTCPPPTSHPHLRRMS